MPFTLKYAASAALVASVLGLVHEMPSPTVGMGLPLMDIMPTEAPSMELVKRNLVKKALTNTCSDWTIPGLDGGGIPICGASETCLFTSASDGILYEGCGLTSVPYNWVTLCLPWPQTTTGTVPVSQIWCEEDSPACGYYAFVYDSLNTFYNFGCSTSSYSSIALLVSTSGTLAGGDGASAITQPPTVTVTQSPTLLSPVTTTAAGSSATNTNPTINSHTSSSSSKPPIGAIVGGAVGGVVVIGLAVFLTWFCMRRRNRQSQTSTGQYVQTDPAASAFLANQHNSQHQLQNQNPHMSELGGNGGNGMAKPPAAAGFFTPKHPDEKPSLITNTQEVHHGGSSPGGSDRLSTQSPPPQYVTPYTPGSHPSLYPGNFTELENTGRQSVPPVSPGSPNPAHSRVSVSNASELGVGRRPVSPFAANTAELPSTQQPQQAGYSAYVPNQAHAGVQEMQGANFIAYPPNQVRVGAQEMSGTGGIARPQRQQRPQGGMDMSGNPLGDNWQGHELE